MEDYPTTLAELERRFTTEEACRDYLVAVRWPEGFICPRCGHDQSWTLARGLFQCTGCDTQTSVTAGTVLEGTRKPLSLWFRAMWHVTSQKNGVSALGLQRVLGLGSYETAWTWLHKLRNVLDKLPNLARAEVKAWLHSVRDAPTPEAGREAAAETIARFEGRYPAAMKSLADDLEASLAQLRLPVAHRKYVRTTNLIERSFVEERRRTKVIPRFFDERSCLKLAFGALERASRRWQRVTIMELEQRQLEMLRRELEPDPPHNSHTSTLAA